MDEQSLFAIIVAGGSGARMNSTIPKQFLELEGKPLLMHTIDAFFGIIPDKNIILVLPENSIPLWNELMKLHNFEKKITTVAGGNTRSASVINGLSNLPENGIVAIHDGVRPFVSKKLVLNALRVAGEQGSAIPSLQLKDSIRKIEGDRSKAVDRSLYRIVQTPQVFTIANIKIAYKCAEHAEYSDDASVLEAAGYPIAMVEGSYDNIKITTPDDLILASHIIKKKAVKNN